MDAKDKDIIVKVRQLLDKSSMNEVSVVIYGGDHDVTLVKSVADWDYTTVTKEYLNLKDELIQLQKNKSNLVKEIKQLNKEKKDIEQALKALSKYK